MGHPVLRRRAQEVDDPTAPEVRRLVRDMIETVADGDGLGLAAPQVYVPRRVVIFFVPPLPEGAGEDEGPELSVLVNPVVEPIGEAQEPGWEGCLSVPGLRGLVPRFTRVRYRAHTLEGATIERVAEGLHARVVQHECDHLDGILYPQRMTDLSSLLFESEIKHLRAGAAERGEGGTEVEDEAPAPDDEAATVA